MSNNHTSRHNFANACQLLDNATRQCVIYHIFVSYINLPQVVWGGSSESWDMERTRTEMEIDVEEGKVVEEPSSRLGGHKPTEPGGLSEEPTEEETGSGSSSCLTTNELNLSKIKEMLESLDLFRRLHGTSNDTAESLEHSLTSLNIRNRDPGQDREEQLGFCAAISLADGSVLHTTTSLTSTLGYPGNPTPTIYLFAGW